jgi:hypothetical protein
VELAGSFLAFVDPPEYYRAALPPLKPTRATSLRQSGRWVERFGHFFDHLREGGEVPNAAVGWPRSHAPTVHLNDIVDALEMQFDDSSSFLDRETGQVATVSHVLLRKAEESGDEKPDLPPWQEQEWEIAKRIVCTDRFEELPTKADVHEWGIMEDFAHSVESESIREDLLHAIHGAGAFRYFKDTLRRHGIESAWFAFRTETLRHIALSWCEENHIACE